MSARLRRRAGQPPLILIVEDDRAVASMIGEFLGSAGYDTEVARDGQDAITKAKQFQPDVIIMDLMLPRLTGGEAASRLKQDALTSHIPIVGISAVADVTALAELLPLDDIIPKPFDLDDLLNAVDRHKPEWSDDVSS
jgi:CheY-like chemotaxis protein